MLKKDILKPKIFELDFFKENNFKRFVCKKCKKGFWSLTERETCSEPPCDIYHFIGNPIFSRKYDWKQIREMYIKWFEKNNHQPINRYSTVARWKPDTFFTGASIYCFMPWVLNKTIEPPANPLVMSQPSLRFGDLDNVGLGSGRHLSFFEMMAHHAFNNSKKVYWKSKTTEYCYRWLTEELKVKPEKIIFKESWWEGGGNAGPCLEVLVDGNELATLVFLEFDGPFNGDYKQMGMKVVDTGYGLERHVWGSQGTPTIYDCIYGSIIDFLKKKSGIKTDEKVLIEFCRLCGELEIKEKNVEVIRQKIINEVSKKLKVDIEGILKTVLPYHKIYQIADHTKTITFILNDGVVPSNVQEGYLARLLIRRCIGNMNELNIDIPLSKIVEKQINDCKDIYPELNENREDILKMVDIEQEKYLDALKRGEKIVKKMDTLSLGDKATMELYESHGLLPRDIKRFVPEIKINLSDIETKIAVQKSTVKIPVKEKIYDVSDLPETRKLYYKDEKLFEFKAKILKIDNKNVVLDQTAFYPRGGGQEPDKGTINNCEVYDVESEGNVIIHKIEKPNFKVNETVNCKIDSKRREQIIKHHTATHLINGASKKILGNHVWQAGSKKDIDKAHLDITHYESLSDEQIKEIERIVNEIIKKEIKVKKEILHRTEAENRYGFRLYQGGAVPGKMLRIISVENFDAEACGGLHVDNTSEIEEVFIFNSKKMQDGIVRIQYVAGKDLVKEMKRKKKLEEKEMLERFEKKKAKIAKEKLKLKTVKEEVVVGKYRPDIEITTRTGEKVYLEFKSTEDMKKLEIMGNYVTTLNPHASIILVGNGIVCGFRGEKSKFNIKKLVKEAAEVMGGSAGGFENEFKGGGPLVEKGKEAFEKIKDLIKD